MVEVTMLAQNMKILVFFFCHFCQWETDIDGSGEGTFTPWLHSANNNHHNVSWIRTLVHPERPLP
jgi:hypothetical protein